MKRNPSVLCVMLFFGCWHSETSPLNKNDSLVSNSIKSDKEDKEKIIIKSVVEMPDSVGCLSVFRENESGEIGWQFEQSEISYSMLPNLLNLIEQLIQSRKLKIIVYVVEMQGGPKPDTIEHIATLVAGARADIQQFKIVNVNTSISIDVNQ
jgi:hypothetical protein